MLIPSVAARLARTSSLHAVARGSVIRTRAGVGAMHPSCRGYALGLSRRYDSTLQVASSEPAPLHPPNSIHRGSKSSDPCSYFIKPREPTILSHKEYHELSSIDLLLPLPFTTMHVVPELLDIERFNIALAKALSSFPLPAGRLVRPDTPDTPWAIRLTNSGIPVTVIDSDADEIFPTDLTVQPTSRYVNPTNTVGIVNTEGESNEPLLRLTITRFTKLNTTSIGASNSHVLYDGFGFLMFFRHLSQLYQGLGPIDPPPYHEPEAIKFEEPSKVSPPLFVHVDPSTPPPWEQPEWRAQEFVTLRLTDTQLTEIHTSVTKGRGHPRTTKMGTMLGLFARCLSEVEPESKPIDTITYVINQRGMGIYPANAAGNAVLYLPVGLQPPRGPNPHDDVFAHAVEIRESLQKLTDPESVRDLATDFARVQSQAAWDKRSQGPPREGSFVADVIRGLDWRGPHFGHPRKTRFHISLSPCPRILFIMTPNPKFVDGTWISKEDEIEVALYVPPNRRKMFEALLEGYAKDMGMTGSVEFLSQL